MPIDDKSPNQLTVNPLKDYGLLVVSGPDALSFLQGQLTCDMTTVDTGKGLHGAHCNVKGRMRFTFLIGKLEPDTFGLRMPNDQLEYAKAALQKYAVFSKVELGLSHEYQIVILANDLMPATLSQCPFHVVANSAGLFIELGDGLSELWIKSDTDPSDIFNAKLQENSKPVSDKKWREINIRSGVAQITEHTRELFTPQDCNFQTIGGVSFKKGCYTGQEVVARLHYKASLKKHMYLAQLNRLSEKNSSISSGDFLQGENGEKLLQVVNIELDKSADTAICLCIANDKVVQGSRSIMLDDKLELSWLPLPYELETENGAS